VPSLGDNVFITSPVTVTLTTAVEVATLTLNSSPTLTGSGTLTLDGASSWLSGAMSGSGRTIVAPEPHSRLRMRQRLI